MQPYFFPYFEHFRLIEECDQWIVFDIAQYSRKSWINRNRILNREKGWAYLSVPVRKTGLDTAIKDAPINTDSDWRKAIFDKLRIYEQEAPGYGRTMGLLESVLSEEFVSIADLNVSGLRKTCDLLGVTTPISIVSDMNLALPDDCAPGEWALEICLQVGASRYINPAGGKDIFDEVLYREKGINLEFHEHIEMKYANGSFEFVPDLSVIDYLMWNDDEQLSAWLGHDQG
jgi:hypothetical protein